MTRRAELRAVASFAAARRRVAPVIVLIGVALAGCGPSSTAPLAGADVRVSAAANAATSASSLPGGTAPVSGAAVTWPGSGAVSAEASGPGLLTVSLSGLPAPGVREVLVRVEEVTAHVAGSGWIVVSATPVDVDLLLLGAPSTVTLLGSVALPAGTVTQLRLLLAPSAVDRGTVDPVDHVVLASGAPAPLEVPSGEQSGVKILGPFTIAPCGATEVTLELDTPRSLWIHRTGGVERWILRPVIRPRITEGNATTCPTSGVASGGGGGDAGGACERDDDCLSQTCVAGTCAPAGPGGACATDAGCTSGACLEGACGPGETGSAGSVCAVPAECMSNDCADGECQPGAQGAPCRTSADCIATLHCVVTAQYGGTCEAPSY